MGSAPEPLVVSFFGWSESGKTTLIVALVGEARRRGIACAAAKCTRHAGDFEPEGKDTARYRAAGASPVAYIGMGQGGTTALFSPTPALPDRRWLAGLFPGSALILVEGLELEGALRVLVARGPGEPKLPLERVDILVSDDDGMRRGFSAGKKKAYAPEDIPRIFETLEESWKGT